MTYREQLYFGDRKMETQKLVLEGKITDQHDETVWLYSGNRRVRRMGKSRTHDGNTHYTAEWHPCHGIYFTRIQPATSLADARAWLRHAYLPGRMAITATGRSFRVEHPNQAGSE